MAARARTSPEQAGHAGNGSAPRANGTTAPPSDVAAEESLLGACLLSSTAIDVALDHQIAAADFYKPSHAHVYAAIVDLAHAGEAVDPVTVSAHLNRIGLLDDIGGAQALLRLQGATPATANAGRYARIVAELATYRRLLAASSELRQLATSAPPNLADALDEAERIVLDATEQPDQADTSSLADEIADHRRRLTEGETPGLDTPWPELTDLINGMRGGQLIVIGGRPSMGKSAVGLAIAAHAAGTLGTPTLHISLEMTKRELLDRLVSSRSKLPLSLIIRTGAGRRDVERIEGTLADIEAWPLDLRHKPGLTLTGLTARARRVRGLGLIIIDYLQLMNGQQAGRRYESREREIADLSAGLKAIAGNFKVPVVALAQLNRNVEARKDKRPQLGDLRESGAIENDADVIVLLYRDDYYNPESKEKGALDMVVAKQRSGPAPKLVRVWFTASTSSVDSPGQAQPSMNGHTPPPSDEEPPYDPYDEEF